MSLQQEHKGATWILNQEQHLDSRPFTIALAVIGWSQVTCDRRYNAWSSDSFTLIQVKCNQAISLESRWSNTLIPALLHLPTASGTAARGGSIMDMRPTKHRFSVGKFTSSVSNAKPSGNWSSGRLKWQKPLRKNTITSVHSYSFHGA